MKTAERPTGAMIIGALSLGGCGGGSSFSGGFETEH